MKPIEKYLKDAIATIRKAQEEILFPCELYTQLEEMQSALEGAIENKMWKGHV